MLVSSPCVRGLLPATISRATPRSVVPVCTGVVRQQLPGRGQTVRRPRVYGGC